MKPEVAYLAAYALVVDEKIHDKEWFLLNEFIGVNYLDNSSNVLTNVLNIIGDRDEKILFKDIIEVLRSSDEIERNTAISLCAKIVFCDDIYSSEEMDFIDSVSKRINIDAKFLANVIKEAKSEVSDVDYLETTSQKKGRFFYKILASIMPANFAEKMRQRYRDCLLSGVDYADAIKKMQVIAKQDIVWVRNSFNEFIVDVDNCNNNLYRDIMSIKNHLSRLATNGKDDGNNEICCILDELESNINTMSSEIKFDIRKTLSKKEDSIRNYTISFMGRTKAGKSTLHSVILGGVNKEFIGKGQERTTRYNRVYQWNGIRIIDTPGIGAPGGKSDEEIAQSVIDESDLICYVVTSDSVQETEFNFFSKLKNQNKPVVILLNKKENFARTNSMKEKFLSDPLAWYTRADKDAIAGSIKRIDEYVRKHISNIELIIHPVQLLSAQLSLVEQDETKKQKYYEGSRIQTFLDELRIQILEEGVLKRSQNILDGSIYYFSKYEKELSNYVNYCSNVKNKFDIGGQKALGKIKEEGKKRHASLEAGLRELYNAFEKADIKQFAESHYSIVRGSKIESAFKEFIQTSGLEARIKNRIERETTQYKDTVNNILTEFSENFDFAFSNFEFKLENINNTRKIIERVGNVIGLVGAIVAIFNPVGIWIGIGGVVISLVAMLFKSKEKKIKELYDNLINQFAEQKRDQIRDILKNFDETDVKIQKNISDTFTSLSRSVGTVLNNIQPLYQNCLNHQNYLNQRFAMRIINFVKKTDNTNPDTLSVKREFGKSMIIKGVLGIGIDEEKLSRMLQEKIVITK